MRTDKAAARREKRHREVAKAFGLQLPLRLVGGDFVGACGDHAHPTMVAPEYDWSDLTDLEATVYDMWRILRERRRSAT